MEVPDGEPPESSDRAVSAAIGVLSAAGVASPRVDAELLLAHVLGVPRGRLALAQVTAAQLADYRGLVEARAGRVPLQHLTGTAPFRDLELAVGPGVFIPRPETELLVEWGLGLGAGTVVDLCAGSGAIGLSFTQSEVYAVERAPAALAWLRRNVAGSPVTVVEGDIADATLLSTLEGRVDLVLCNPPYVPDATVVDPEVLRDPPDSVFAGPDGLAVIRQAIACAARLLRPGGWFGVEHDASQADLVPPMFVGFDEVVDHRDLAGRPRFCTGRILA